MFNKTIENRKRYICEALRTIYMQQFKYVCPFVIIGVEVDKPFFTELPDPLHIGNNK